MYLHPQIAIQRGWSGLKLVEIVDDEQVAKLLADPIRRTILNLVRENAMSEAQLAKRLGLTDATVNYHIGAAEETEVARRN